MARFGVWLDAWLARGSDASGKRLNATERPALIYAVGDVHGCLGPLLDLEARVVADAAGATGEKWIVMLGDYVDRGPQSAQVIDHLIGPPPPGFKRICLRGNHDDAMLAALELDDGLEAWLAWGVQTTLASYGLNAEEIAVLEGPGPSRGKRELLRARVPPSHIEFLRSLPVLVAVPGYVFVHAGLRPGIALAKQRDHDLLWIRGEFLDADYDFGAVVVHGHTPDDEPFLSPRRVGIDTACFASGRLTAVRVSDDGVQVLS